MKKLVVLSLIGLLILAFGTVYAQEKKEEPKLEFKASGFIDVQTEYFRNAQKDVVVPFKSTYPFYGGTVSPTPTIPGDKKHAFWDTRCRLKFDAVYGPNVSGTIFFEMDSTYWGDNWSGKDRIGYLKADQAAVEVKNLYFDFGLPFIPVPTTVRAGLQNFALRPGILITTDATGITAGIKVDPAMIRLYYFKYLEGDTWRSDDVDVYGINPEVKIETINIGAYGVYFNMNTYPVSYGKTDKAKMLYVGAYADGKVGPVNINFDFVIDSGKNETTDVKYRGWATRLKVNYPWEAFNFGIIGAYGSGDKVNTANKKEWFVTPPGSESAAAFGESLVFFSSWVNRGNTGIWGGTAGGEFFPKPLGGVWYALLYGSFKATPWYKVTLQALYIGDTTKDGNTLAEFYVGSGTSPNDGKTIGFEFDLYNEFQIYKQLTYTIAGGFMTKGNAMKFYNSATGETVKPKTPWIIISCLKYSF